jgi:hypothetical protein
MKVAGILKPVLRLWFLALTVVVVISIGSNGQLVASQSLPVTVAGFTPKGWRIFDEVKQFTPENLYEQINGRASFFLAYDMIMMTTVSFAKNSDETAKFINLSIYDMGTPTNAFGVFCPAGWYDWSTKSLAKDTSTLVELQGLLKRAGEAGIGLIGMKTVRYLAPFWSLGKGDPTAFDHVYDEKLKSSSFSPFQRAYAYVLQHGIDVVNADMQNFKHLEENIIAAVTADGYR